MEAFDDKYLWYCRTCMACMEICPATINHVDTLIEMRRFLVQGESHFPKELTGVFKGWKNMSNPWNLAANIRSEWSSGLNIMPPSNIEDFEFLYFVGCAGSFDDRNKLVSRAFVQIMKRAGVKFIYLGNDEKCCGETARRLGNEFLAQSMIEFNIRKWNQLGIKKIVTACPHCYNTIKNEYGQFGGHYEVLHHTELLEKILKEKRLTPSSCFFPEIPIVYHDPCYLCRANGIYETPRKVLKSALDINITEPKNHGPLSICCGGGGGSMWIEERDKKRASIIRFEQLMKTGAKTIVTACPYCLIMLDDEIKIRNLNDKIKVYDIVQILSRFIGD
jgi:Fe-S oxidoreductase